jgi:hypothetical protein
VVASQAAGQSVACRGKFLSLLLGLRVTQDVIVKTIIAALSLSLLMLLPGCSGKHSNDSQATGESQSAQAALDELNDALRLWMARNPVPPGDYDQLVSSKYYDKPAPSAPPGKKYALNPRELRVVLIDQ